MNFFCINIFLLQIQIFSICSFLTWCGDHCVVLGIFLWAIIIITITPNTKCYTNNLGLKTRNQIRSHLHFCCFCLDQAKKKKRRRRHTHSDPVRVHTDVWQTNQGLKASSHLTDDTFIGQLCWRHPASSALHEPTKHSLCPSQNINHCCMLK